MKLTIIGRGAVGQALARALRRHEVTFGVRSPQGSDQSPMLDAAAAADAVILATPWSVEAQVAAAIAPGVAGKLVIDATNPVGMSDHGLDLVGPKGRAAAQALQDRLPGAHVVKCFNQIGQEFLADPARLVVQPVMFAAGDDAAARSVALSLAADAGFEDVDAGPLSNARHLESLAMLWIWNAARGELGRTFGFALSHTAE